MKASTHIIIALIVYFLSCYTGYLVGRGVASQKPPTVIEVHLVLGKRN